jgi:hypothetical protein
MISSLIILIFLYLLFKYAISWINYYNQTDKRFGNSTWRWSYDYPVIGERDISDLDDKFFVRLRRKRNKVITAMYLIVFLFFLVLMSFFSNLLLIILN